LFGYTIKIEMASSQMKNCATHVTVHLPIEFMDTYSKSGISNSISVKNFINFSLAFLNIPAYVGISSVISVVVGV
jgi:hypothetical protein